MPDRTPLGSGAGKVPSLIRNWISLAGIILAASSFFAVACLIGLDFYAGFSNPYTGILTYIIAPVFLSMGLLLILVGVLRERHRRRGLAPGEIPAHLRIDFNVPHQRNAFIIVVVVTFVFLMFTALGSYRTYEFTESVQFCGETCHGVMKPEYTAYQNSPHARVACVQCHVGPGATWYLKSKLAGSYQVYATIFDKYPRPIPAPLNELRPAQQTCEQCHWPEKFFGSVEKVNQHFAADETNTPWTIRMLVKVGGGDPSQGPVGGIHWHMSIANKVEYIATDEARQQIPWVRFTDHNGKVTVYQSSDNPIPPAKLSAMTPRRMDCIDCHNRPSHIYNDPDHAVDQALSTGRMDASLSFVKKHAIEALTGDYKDTGEALTRISASLTKDYATSTNRVAVVQAIAEVQNIYTNNFFPEMKVSWRAYPSNIGHLIFPGCYRCHDGKHVSDTGQPITHNCDACHTIISQGRGGQVASISPQGLEFKHPTDIEGMWKDMNCSDCHNGGLVGQ